MFERSAKSKENQSKLTEKKEEEDDENVDYFERSKNTKYYHVIKIY